MAIHRRFMLQDDRDKHLSPEYYRPEETQDRSTLLRTAAGVGLGLLGVGIAGRTRLGKKAMHTALGGIADATRHIQPRTALEGAESVLQRRRAGERVGIGTALDEIGTRIKTRADEMRRVPHLLEKTIGETEHVRRNLTDHLSYTDTFQRFTSRLHRDLPEDQFQDFTERLARRGHRGLRDPDAKGFKTTLRRTLEPERFGYQGKSADDLLENMRTSLRQAQAETGSEEFIKRNIQGAERELERTVSDTGQQRGVMDRLFGLAGLRRTTTQDLVQQGQRGTVRTPTPSGAEHLDLTEELSRRVTKDQGFGDMMTDPLVFQSDVTGKTIDFRHINTGIQDAIESLGRNVSVPFIGIRPFRLGYLDQVIDARRQPRAAILGLGDYQPVLTGTKSPSPYPHLFAGGRVSEMGKEGLSTVHEDAYLASAKFGPVPRLTQKLTGVGVEGEDPRGPIKRTLGLGDGEGHSILEEWSSVFGKAKRDSRWERKAAGRLRNLTSPISPGIQDDIFAVRGGLRKKTEALPQETMDQIRREFGADDLLGTSLDLTDDQAVLDAFEHMAHGRHLSGGFDQSTLAGNMKEQWRRYAANPQGFLQSRRRVSNQVPLINREETIDQIDDVRRLVQQETIDQVKRRTGKDPVAQLSTRLPSGHIDSIRDLDVLNQLEYYGRNIETDSIRNEFIDKIQHQDLGEEIYDTARRKTNIFEQTVEQTDFEQLQRFSTVSETQQSLAIGKHKGLLTSINESIKQAGLDPMKQYTKQFTAGRHRPEDITTGTLFPFGMMERLSTTLDSYGLGFSRRHMGSPQELFGNMLVRRGGAALGIMQGYRYADYETENLTGKGISERAADGLKGAQLGIIGARESLGMVDAAERRRELYPGIEQVAEDSPIGMPLAFMGMTGDRDVEEHEEYLEEGHAPIRRGRFWRLGSSTPWRGEDVEFFRPSWYRRMTSPSARVKGLYGSEDDYWANQWMPTPRYPGAPIRRFLTDPYYLEKENFHERPYPETGPLKELEEIPIIGSLVSGTIGEALKPTIEMRDMEQEIQQEIQQEIREQGKQGKNKKLHRDELTALNESIKEQGAISKAGKQAEGAYLYSTPGGMTQLSYIDMPPDAKAEDLRAKPIPIKGKDLAEEDLKHINEFIKASGKEGKQDVYLPVPAEELPNIPGGARVSRKFITDDVRGVHGHEEKLDNLMSMNDPRFRLGDTVYSMADISGIYGWMTGEFLGGDASDIYQGKEMLYRGPVKERARMDTYTDAFWDRRFGGFPGDLSEIVRRFIPRDRRVEYVNFLENEMPDWMPGDDYHIQYNRGDPFRKIPMGDERLPGAGYEALNDLHPDQFGEYGAFDRFKILADVAPYSDEYNRWERYVRQNIDKDSELYDDFQATLERRRKQTQGEEFYEYNFRDADIARKRVTVEEMIDPSTFLIEESDAPIRLAGVRLREDEREYIEQFIYPGAEVDIGIDEVPERRVEDDTYGTIRAAVWKSGVALNRSFIEHDIGRELESDYSPAGIHARFSPDERMKAEAWEWFRGLDTPLHNRYLPARSAFEAYKQDHVYGKEFQGWGAQDMLQPTYESFIERNPVASTVLGAGIGALFGGTRRGRMMGATIGGLVTGAGSLYTSAKEAITGERWIPERRRTEWEIEEYFDKLEYIKNRSLFQKYRRKAIDKEGIDPASLAEDIESGGDSRQRTKRDLEELKKEVVREGVDEPRGELISEINEYLAILDEEKDLEEVNTYTAKALHYRDSYEKTVYGADPYGSWQDIFSALPSKHRDFFSEFAEVEDPEKQNEILEVLPPYQKRLYEAAWGREPEPRKDLGDYFEDHYLPDRQWGGWREDIKLDDIKYKVVSQEGLDQTEFNLWEDDRKRAEMLQIDKPDNFRRKNEDLRDVEAEIRKLLAGVGLNSHVKAQYVPDSKDINVNLEIKQRLESRLKKTVEEQPEILIS